MNDSPIKYQRRIVCFLDVLGFASLLNEFEHDADLENEVFSSDNLVSAKANEFIIAFKSVVQLIPKNYCRYYLFSDNICISADVEEDRNIANEILFVVSNLFQRMASLGYFLRGGIDYGWMLDEEDIAVGIPLANAYHLESKVAIYPRVVISDSFCDLLKDIDADFDYQLKSDEGLTYIDPFYSVIKAADRVEFFETYRVKIQEKLAIKYDDPKIEIKFKWLAETYNFFLEEFIEKNGIMLEDEEVSEEELDRLRTLKIELV
ncbi:hypothetical protein [Algoriphagus aquimarinus]|uniref:Guanylate cyclase domain-containing protein n=1 Tax=Algoriphagus aquimarinus TaxID=237018 RepID=A0A5C7ABJ2_9BACT|nr:hypothetical protein [Algoriphagus aquimarinus]TXE03079.1 hypothetical protein ESV85_20665 [Algoriphagus aquimarinus]